MVKTYVDGKQVTADTETLAELTDVNTTLLLQLTELESSVAELEAANTKLATQITQLTTSNTELTDVNSNLVLQLADLSSLIAKKLNQDDVPNLALPYNYSPIQEDFSALDETDVPKIITFTEADWGADTNYYPISLTLLLYSGDEDIGRFFDSELIIRVFNPTATLQETIFARTYKDKNILFDELTVLIILNPDFETGDLTSWTTSGTVVSSSDEAQGGTYSAKITGNGSYIEQDGLFIPSRFFYYDIQGSGKPSYDFYIYRGAGSHSIEVETFFDDGATSIITLSPGAGAWTLFGLAQNEMPSEEVHITKIRWTIINGDADDLFYLDTIAWDQVVPSKQWIINISLPQAKLLNTETLKIILENNLGSRIDIGRLSIIGLAK